MSPITAGCDVEHGILSFFFAGNQIFSTTTGKEVYYSRGLAILICSQHEVIKGPTFLIQVCTNALIFKVEATMVDAIVLVIGCLGITTIGLWWMLRKTQIRK